jgi:hypothetical protein
LSLCQSQQQYAREPQQQYRFSGGVCGRGRALLALYTFSLLPFALLNLFSFSLLRAQRVKIFWQFLGLGLLSGAQALPGYL